MKCVVPLGCTNKATLGIKLPPATVPAWQVNCGCLCTSLNTCTMAAFLFKCTEEPAYGSPPAPTTHPTPLPPTHPLYTESRILVRPEKKCLKFQQHQLASYNSYKILATYITTLLIQWIWRPCTKASSSYSILNF